MTITGSASGIHADPSFDRSVADAITCSGIEPFPLPEFDDDRPVTQTGDHKGGGGCVIELPDADDDDTPLVVEGGPA